jgi:hypothetical protein
MRVANHLVFDENIEADNSGGSSQQQFSFRTDQSWAEKLGAFDMLAIMAVVDNVKVTGSGNSHFAVQIEHSADGRNFKQKNMYAEIGQNGSSTYTITLATSSGTTAQTPYVGGDAGIPPSLGFVQLRTDLVEDAGCTASAHVRIYVTGRNWGNR